MDKLVEERNETAEEVKIVGKNEDKCSSCILYIVLFSIIFIINIGIATYFVYHKYMNRNKENVSMCIKEKIINVNGRSQINRDFKSNI